MKKLCTLAAGLFLTFTAFAQQPDSVMMKKWEDFMTPGKMHEMIAKWDGNWTTEATMWMSPDAQPMTSKGTCTNKMILGGRYQQSNHKSMMMGQPFEGMGIFGYDNAKKVFFSSWIDNMGTGVMYLEGTYIQSSGVFNFSGKCSDPMTGQDMNVREVYKVLDANNHLMTMYMPGPSGREFKTMEIRFTRNKK